jgi:hypothetical protein
MDGCLDPYSRASDRGASGDTARKHTGDGGFGEMKRSILRLKNDLIEAGKIDDSLLSTCAKNRQNRLEDPNFAPLF